MPPALQDLDLDDLPAKRQLAAWLAAVGWTWQRLAREVGVSKQHLTMVASGARTSAPLTERIRALTGVQL